MFDAAMLSVVQPSLTWYTVSTSGRTIGSTNAVAFDAAGSRRHSIGCQPWQVEAPQHGLTLQYSVHMYASLAEREVRACALRGYLQMAPIGNCNGVAAKATNNHGFGLAAGVPQDQNYRIAWSHSSTVVAAAAIA